MEAEATAVRVGLLLPWVDDEAGEDLGAALTGCEQGGVVGEA
jgi:hypothetical protein